MLINDAPDVGGGSEVALRTVSLHVRFQGKFGNLTAARR